MEATKVELSFDTPQHTLRLYVLEHTGLVNRNGVKETLGPPKDCLRRGYLSKGLRAS